MAHYLQRLDHHAAFPADAGRVCFADEAAIDFPSVRAAVARICEALAGATEARPIDVPLTLSPGDARRGLEVVLSVPLRQTCAACGGRGEIWADPCVTCAGAGDAVASHDVTIAVAPGVRDGSRVRARVGVRHAPVTHVVLHISVR
jgi:molecular chaperone DnaJ